MRKQSLAALAGQHQEILARLEGHLGHRFRDPLLLLTALMHSSFAFEKGGQGVNNERLEFLGDAVLDLAVGEVLYRRFPEMREGELTRLRAALVNEGHLALMAREIGLNRSLFLGKGEELSGGRRKPSILASGFEAVVGALYLDGGIDRTRRLVERLFAPWIDKRRQGLSLADAKTALQELLQERYSEAPAYVLEGEEGPDHDKRFSVSVRFQGRVLGRGRARSKKEAEQQAAAEALAQTVSLEERGRC